MYFLAPAFAFFTVLFVVPVIIHLVGRRRARVRRFPAMAFLLAGHRRVAQRTRLRQVLLMLLRAAVMAAVPLCLAKPYVTARSDLPAQVGGTQSAVLLLDDSLSMRYRLGGESLFARAQRRAARVLDALGRDADVALVLGSRGAPAPVPELTGDRARLLRALGGLHPSYRSADLGTAIKRAAQILSTGRGSERRIYLFSDLAAHAFDGSVGPPADIEVVPVDVTEGKALPNRAVVDLKVDAAPTLGPHGVRVIAEVANFAEAPARELPVTLLVDGKAVARGLLDLTGRGRAAKRFYHVLGRGGPGPAEVAASKAGGPLEALERESRAGANSAPGIHDISVEIGGDDLPADDRRFLRIEVQRTLRVLIVDGEPRTLRRDDEIFFLETALRPGDRDDSQIELSTVAPEELPRRSLSEYDAIFLCNVKAQDLTRGQRARPLLDYVAGGGGLFISVGENVDPDAYNGALGELLPQALAGTKTTGPLRRSSSGAAAAGADDGVQESTLTGPGERLGRMDRRHPLLVPFIGGHAAESLGEARFFRYMLLRPTPRSTGEAGEGGNAPSVILSYDTGAPALLERAHGAGRVLLFTSSIDRDWNDLPIQPAYLPLMQQAVRYLSRAPLKEPEPPALVGQRHEIRLHDGDSRVELTLPSGQKRLFEGERLRGRRLLGFSDTEEPGLYRVAAAGEGSVLRPRPVEFFAVNVDPVESDLRRAAAARIEGLSRPVQRGGEHSVPLRRVELWHLLGALLLLLLLGEALLLREK